MIKKKGQTWLTDYIVALTLFTVIIFIAITSLDGITYGDEFVLVEKEVGVLSDTLMSEGIPVDWDTANVIRPGLLDADNRIDLDKVNNFSALDENNVKIMIGLRGEYVVSFYDVNGSAINLCSDCNSSDGDYDSLAVINRLSVYNGTTVIMRVEVQY